MKSREELLRESASNPTGVADYAFELQEHLQAKDQALAQKEGLLAEKEQLLAEARAYIAELKRQLFGPKADKLTPEQEEQLRQLTGDVQEQAGRPAPLSREVLEAESAPTKKSPNARGAIRCRRCNWRCAATCSSPPTRTASIAISRDPRSARKPPPNTITSPPNCSSMRRCGPSMGSVVAGAARPGSPSRPCPRGWCRRASWAWGWRSISC